MTLAPPGCPDKARHGTPMFFGVPAGVLLLLVRFRQVQEVAGADAEVALQVGR